jgi:ADP-ribosylation factor 2-binding protein
MQAVDNLAVGVQGLGLCVKGDEMPTGDEIIAADPVFDGSLGDEDLGSDLDIIDTGSSQSSDDHYFDIVVGKLMDILIEEDFEEKQAAFVEKHCHCFEDTEENKLEYMDIYKQYTDLVETHLDDRLHSEIEDFDMDRFYELLSTREDNLVGEVFEMLLSLSDFNTFKELMLSYKSEQNNGSFFDISIRPMTIKIDEEDDGDLRPDLDDQLIVSPIGGISGAKSPV